MAGHKDVCQPRAEDLLLIISLRQLKYIKQARKCGQQKSRKSVSLWNDMRCVTCVGSEIKQENGCCVKYCKNCTLTCVNIYPEPRPAANKADERNRLLSHCLLLSLPAFLQLYCMSFRRRNALFMDEFSLKLISLFEFSCKTCAACYANKYSVRNRIFKWYVCLVSCCLHRSLLVDDSYTFILCPALSNHRDP